MRARTVTIALILALAPAAAGLSGCGAKRTSETTTETIEYPAGSTLPGGEVAERDTEVRITRETTTVKEEDRGRGVLGTVAHVTWELVKLPFRILGFVVDIIL